LDGYAGLQRLDAHIQRLKIARPDIILVGLGTPHQELLSSRLLQEVAPKLVWSIGGFLEFASGTAVRAPGIVRAARLEWLWRLIREPARLWRRTFIEGPWLAHKLLAPRLEWLWRLIREPARLWRQTSMQGPWFAHKLTKGLLVVQKRARDG